MWNRWYSCPNRSGWHPSRETRGKNLLDGHGSNIVCTNKLQALHLPMYYTNVLLKIGIVFQCLLLFLTATSPTQGRKTFSLRHQRSPQGNGSSRTSIFLLNHFFIECRFALVANVCACFLNTNRVKSRQNCSKSRTREDALLTVPDHPLWPQRRNGMAILIEDYYHEMNQSLSF